MEGQTREAMRLCDAEAASKARVYALVVPILQPEVADKMSLRGSYG
jgi:hypothetical protein